MSKRNHLSKKKNKHISSHFGISDGDKIDKETGLIEELHVITVLLTDMKNEFFLHRMEMELEERNYETQLLRWEELENITDSLLEKLSHYEFDLSLLEGLTNFTFKRIDGSNGSIPGRKNGLFHIHRSNFFK